MKIKISFVLAFFLVLGFLPLTTNAQEPEKTHQLYWVLDVEVKPSMETEYFEVGKKWTALITKHEVPFPFNALWFGDNHVFWIVPIENFADIDKINEAINKIRKKAPDEYKSVADAFSRTTYSSRECVFALDFKYSMIAKETGGESEEENFRFYDIYYFKPGYEAELDKLFDEMKTLMKDKGILQSWYMYRGVMGTDDPVLWMGANAKNAKEFYEENAKMWEAIGKEGSKIKQKMMKFVRKQEQKTAWFMKDFSYTPKKIE